MIDVGININIKKIRGTAIFPDYAINGDAGLDLRAALESDIPPGESRIIKTGLSLALPPNHAGLICSRSGLATKNSIAVLNSPGIIDSGYRGEIGVILFNHGNHRFKVNIGDRIAQLLIVSYPNIYFNLAEELGSTERGERGFGSTGT